MLDTVKFALISRIHPHKLCFIDKTLHEIRHKGNSIGYVFFELYFRSNCEDECIQFSNRNEHNCFQLSNIR